MGDLHTRIISKSLKNSSATTSTTYQYSKHFEKQLDDSTWVPPRQQLRTSCPSPAITTPPSTRRLPRPSPTRPSTALNTRTTTTPLSSLSTTRHNSLSSTTTT